jgi:hypothetical protein
MLTIRLTDAADDVPPMEAETIRAAVRHALAHLDAPANVHLDRAAGRWSVKTASVTMPSSGVVINVDREVSAALAALGLASWPRRVDAAR